ncbi:hypothetical protein ACLB1N_25025 [Escherichia coli]
MLGIFSCDSYTPALGQGADLARLGYTNGNGRSDGMSYAMAIDLVFAGYCSPCGCCGLFSASMSRQKPSSTSLQCTNGGALIKTINIRVENPNLHDLAIKDVPILTAINYLLASETRRNPNRTFARYHYPTGRFAASGGSQRIYIMRNW